jgi:hypothetical protein
LNDVEMSGKGEEAPAPDVAASAAAAAAPAVDNGEAAEIEDACFCGEMRHLPKMSTAKESTTKESKKEQGAGRENAKTASCLLPRRTGSGWEKGLMRMLVAVFHPLRATFRETVRAAVAKKTDLADDVPPTTEQLEALDLLEVWKGMLVGMADAPKFSWDDAPDHFVEYLRYAVCPKCEAEVDESITRPLKRHFGRDNPRADYFRFLKTFAGVPADEVQREVLHWIKTGNDMVNKMANKGLSEIEIEALEKALASAKPDVHPVLGVILAGKRPGLSFEVVEKAIQCCLKDEKDRLVAFERERKSRKREGVPGLDTASEVSKCVKRLRSAYSASADGENPGWQFVGAVADDLEAIVANLNSGSKTATGAADSGSETAAGAADSGSETATGTNN